MTATDDLAVIKFMALFSRLRDMIDDEPRLLASAADADEGLRAICYDLGSVALHLHRAERQRARFFAAPASTKFKEAWRDYENRYTSLLSVCPGTS